MKPIWNPGIGAGTVPNEVPGTMQHPSFATTLVAVHSPFFFFFSKRKRIPAEYENLCARVPGGKEPVLFVVDVCPDVLEIPGDFWVVGGLRVDGGNTKLYSIAHIVWLMNRVASANARFFAGAGLPRIFPKFSMGLYIRRILLPPKLPC